MKLKLPSLQKVFQDATITLRRFPFVLAAAIVGTAAAILLSELNYNEEKDYGFLYKIIMCCSLGLNLFLSSVLFGESKKLNKKFIFPIQFTGLGLLVIYYFSLPDFMRYYGNYGMFHIIRYCLFSIGLHLLVAFAPFVGTGNLNGFWQYNRILFLRFLEAVLYSGVLYLGLVLALLAIDNLFGVEIEGKIYGQLWYFLAGVFNTWFFLAGVPANTAVLNELQEYPKGLKIFTQFVLLPLVTIYLAILYVYTGKIIIEWNLPKGWVSYLVICFSIAGIFSLLLIEPIKNKIENAWIKIYARWFYRAMYPLIILLFIAIGTRVIDYGVTENRYFVLVLALWLAIISFYFLFSKIKNIKTIPVSLCVIAFLTSFGPWGAFSVSELSQKNRLEKLLTEVNLFVGGKIQPVKEKIAAEKGKEINSIFHYLDEYHDLRTLQPWFEQNLDSLFGIDTLERYYYHNNSEKILQFLHLTEYSYEQDSLEFSFSSNHTLYAVDVKGYDFYYNLNMYYSDYQNNPYKFFHAFKLGDDSLKIQYLLSEKKMQILKNDSVLIDFDIKKHIRKFSEAPTQHQYSYSYNYNYKYLDPLNMTIEEENEKVKVKFYFSSLDGKTENDSLLLNDLNAALLMKFKD